MPAHLHRCLLCPVQKWGVLGDEKRIMNRLFFSFFFFFCFSFWVFLPAMALDAVQLVGVSVPVLIRGFCCPSSLSPLFPGETRVHPVACWDCSPILAQLPEQINRPDWNCPSWGYYNVQLNDMLQLYKDMQHGYNNLISFANWGVWICMQSSCLLDFAQQASETPLTPSYFNT